MRLLFLLLLPACMTAQRYEANTAVYDRTKLQVISQPGGTPYLGFVDAGDQATFNVPAGKYVVTFRVTSYYGLGQMTVNGRVVKIPKTTGLLAWVNVTDTITAPVVITFNTPRINLNWIEVRSLLPTVNAGPDRIIYFPQDTVQLTGTVAGGVPSWRPLHEGNGWLSETATLRPTAWRLYRNTYLYELSATGPGGTVRDTVQVRAEWRPDDKAFKFPVDLGTFGRFWITNGGGMIKDSAWVDINPALQR